MKNMKKRRLTSRAFSPRELDALELFENHLARLPPNEEARIRGHLIGLEELAGVLHEYPSISASDQLGDACRSEESLIERVMANRSGQDLFSRPTKAIVGRAFLTVKVNLLSHLALAFRETAEGALLKARIDKLTVRLVHLIMVEEALGSIASDRQIAREYRRTAAAELVRMWEHRLAYSMSEFLPPLLDAAWHARLSLNPVLGTMAGTAELFHLSLSLDVGWHFFIQSVQDHPPAVEALEEFLFDLTYEEIARLRAHMADRRLAVIDLRKAEEVLGVRRFYSAPSGRGVKSMHRFFNERRMNAEARLRIGAEGPKRTLEEYMLLYVLSGGKPYASYLASGALQRSPV